MNSTSTIFRPVLGDAAAATITEGDRVVVNRGSVPAGVIDLRQQALEPGYVVVRVGSGAYSFRPVEVTGAP